jgi:phosphoglycerate dehydrogenase-like enzyme
MPRHKVWYIPTSSHTQRVFRPEVFEAMRKEFDVTVNDGDANLTTEQVEKGIAGYEALVTGWGTPTLSARVYENGKALRIVAHSAGSVKHMATREIIDRILVPRDVTIFSGNRAIAYNVAESAIGMLMMTSRRWVDFAMNFRETGTWRPEGVPGNGQYLMGSTLGIVSASAVGREVIRLLQPWDLTILCYDPYLTEAEAGKLGVQKAELDDLFARSDLISVHAPKVPETTNMIGSKELALMKDGATLVNTARGSVIDHDALLREAQTGRILVCLDVTEPEPLPSDSPFRGLRNVLITPHQSGAGYYGYFKIGEQTVQALRDKFAGRPVYGAVDYSRWEQLA